MLQTERLINALVDSPRFLRAKILKMLLKLEESDKSLVPTKKDKVVLNFASNYYYSLYSPSLCAYTAYRAGLKAVAVNDYASLSAGKEFFKACKVLGLPCSVGYHAECVPLFNEKKASCYVYGIAHNQIKNLNEELKPIREEKKQHVEALVKKINSRLKKYSVFISIKDVLASSLYNKGGAVTEKHVAKILSKKILEKYNEQSLLDFLSGVLKIQVNGEDKDCLLAKNNKYLSEDLTRIIYNNIEVFKAGETLREAEEFIVINKNYGGITAYKLRIKNYDEEFLSHAVKELKKRNFEAVCFDDTSLSKEDAKKTTNFILQNGLLPIAVNRMGMPRQIIPQGETDEKLYQCMLAVVGSSISTYFDVEDGIFGVNTLLKCPELETRIDLFRKIIND